MLARTGTKDVVDAAVVSTALHQGAHAILTGDPDVLSALVRASGQYIGVLGI